ncbi:hypothetical protein [Arthrobacter sp. TMS2-4]
MEEPVEKLQISLEDVGGTSWWRGLLTTLSSQYGSATLRFVGTVAGRRRYTSDTFSAARPVAPMPPEEDWAPGMTRSLDQLIRDIKADGWTQTGRGAEPWSLTFERLPTGSRSVQP